MQISTIQFPEISLPTRDAHKLRGYFGSLFKEHSPLLHNHFEDGTSVYRYPMVQYKVIENVPTLVGLAEGAELLVSLFLKINELQIEHKVYAISAKQMKTEVYTPKVGDELHRYKFETHWMALNQKNFEEYLKMEEHEVKDFLNRQVQNNILSFYKGLGYRTANRIHANGQFAEKRTHFKNKPILVFSGNFVTNAYLPNFVGIGKSPSRGFGTIKKIG